jgi:transposase
MAVELSDVKGSLKATAEELGITPQILTRWRRERAPSQTLRTGSGTQGNREQQEILLLKKQLKQAELERDILKKAFGIFSKGDGKYSNL